MTIIDHVAGDQDQRLLGFTPPLSLDQSNQLLRLPPLLDFGSLSADVDIADVQDLHHEIRNPKSEI